MTPSEILVMEVLAARWRLGEASWPFVKAHKRTLNRLEAAGLVSVQGGVVPHTYQVSLTEQGRKAYLTDRYVPRINFLPKMVNLEYVCEALDLESHEVADFVENGWIVQERVGGDFMFLAHEIEDLETWRSLYRSDPVFVHNVPWPWLAPNYLARVA